LSLFSTSVSTPTLITAHRAPLLSILLINQDSIVLAYYGNGSL
jgi:hypothetical protein